MQHFSLCRGVAVLFFCIFFNLAQASAEPRLSQKKSVLQPTQNGWLQLVVRKQKSGELTVGIGFPRPDGARGYFEFPGRYTDFIVSQVRNEGAVIYKLRRFNGQEAPVEVLVAIYNISQNEPGAFQIELTEAKKKGEFNSIFEYYGKVDEVATQDLIEEIEARKFLLIERHTKMGPLHVKVDGKTKIYRFPKASKGTPPHKEPVSYGEIVADPNHPETLWFIAPEEEAPKAGTSAKQSKKMEQQTAAALALHRYLDRVSQEAFSEHDWRVLGGLLVEYLQPTRQVDWFMYDLEFLKTANAANFVQFVERYPSRVSDLLAALLSRDGGIVRSWLEAGSVRVESFLEMIRVLSLDPFVQLRATQLHQRIYPERVGPESGEAYARVYWEVSGVSLGCQAVFY